MQIANLAYDNFLWRLGIGRVYEWSITVGDNVSIINNNGQKRNGKVSKIFVTRGLQRQETERARAWDIVTIAWIADIFVGETVLIGEWEPLPPITVDEPTLSMEFLVNDSPFAGKEWKYMTTRNLQERLEKELQTNVWLKVEQVEWKFIVSGRWELHLSVLIETIRREGGELQVWPPEVIMKKENWVLKEPIEHVVINVEDQFSWSVIENLAWRKWLLIATQSENGMTTMEFEVPTRWLLWFKSQFILMTKGQWIVYSSFSHYDNY
jgi:GTP-binding protein